MHIVGCLFFSVTILWDFAQNQPFPRTRALVQGGARRAQGKPLRAGHSARRSDEKKDNQKVRFAAFLVRLVIWSASRWIILFDGCEISLNVSTTGFANLPNPSFPTILPFCLEKLFRIISCKSWKCTNICLKSTVNIVVCFYACP